jgi:hypothetical protein
MPARGPEFFVHNRAKCNELARNEGKEVIAERGSVKRGSGVK